MVAIEDIPEIIGIVTMNVCIRLTTRLDLAAGATPGLAEQAMS